MIDKDTRDELAAIDAEFVELQDELRADDGELPQGLHRRGVKPPEDD